jgi:hypothetical protein
MNKSDILNLYKFGQYYNPAHSHYNNPSARIVCDRCFETNIK